MSIRSRIGSMAVMLAASFGVLNEANKSAGKSALDFMASSSPGPSFGQRYGSNPRSTENGGKGRGNVARSKRASVKRRNVASRASKRRSHG